MSTADWVARLEELQSEFIPPNASRTRYWFLSSPEAIDELVQWWRTHDYQHRVVAFRCSSGASLLFWCGSCADPRKGPESLRYKLFVEDLDRFPELSTAIGRRLRSSMRKE